MQPTAQDTHSAPGREGGTAISAPPPAVDGERFVCPFCGEAIGVEAPAGRCGHCGAFTDPLSRQATQNEMGPWFVRDPRQPFRPGCRLETIERWVRSGRVTAETVIRGPSTHQNWALAARVPGVARLLGLCHACRSEVTEDEVLCARCGTGLTVDRDRQHLGLAPARALPGRAEASETARRLLDLCGAPTPDPAVTVADARQLGPPTAPPLGHDRGGSSGRPGRFDRRVERAVFRARVSGVIAVLFGVLFVLSMVLPRGEVGAEAPLPAADTPPAGFPDDAS